MSKTSNIIVSAHARATCELFGAHLADINDYNEWNFVKTFSISLGDVRIVMIDGTDEGHETHWVSTHLGSNLTYFNWQSGSPAMDTLRNCLYMYRDAGWQMQGNICTFDAAGYMPRYLCKFKEI